jgi:hypothetical protein
VVKRVRALFRKDLQMRVPTDINRLVHELVRLLRDESIRREVSIRLALGGNLPRLEIDPVQIQQVLLNLATNGMDAMMQSHWPRELTIQTKKHSENEVLVSVEDRGRSVVEAHDGRLWVSNSAHGGAVFQFTVKAQS